MLVLDFPVTMSAECKSKAVEQRILDRMGSNIQNYGGVTWAAMMGECPDLYNKNEWKVGVMDVSLIMKRNGKFYSWHIIRDDRTDRNLQWFDKEKLTKDGRLEMGIDGSFQSKTDLDATVELCREMGKIYLLVEGNSGKDRKPVPQKLAELKTLYQETK